MKKQSFFMKLFIGNLLLVGCIVSIAALVSYRYLNDNYQQQLIDQQQQETKSAAIHFEHIWGKAELAQEDCKKMFADSPLRLTIISNDGHVIADSQANPSEMNNHKTADRPEIISALKGKPTYDTRPSETLSHEFRYYASPIKVNNKIVGVARIAMECKQIAQGSSFIRNALIWAALGAVIVAVILGLLLSWIWYSPLNQITKAATDIASGELENRVSISGAAELEDLSNALNLMRKNLAEQIKQIDAQKSNLQTVVSNLREGVIALTQQGKVVLVNSAAKKLLEIKVDQPINKDLQEIVRIPDVADAFMRASRTKSAASDQFDLVTHGAVRTIDLIAAPVDTSSDDISVLLVMKDITDLARMATIKSEFVANASHELRTPIATIRAAVDSLGELGPADQDEFLRMRDILDRHASRLESIANDLLDLHLIETSKGRLRLSDISTSMISQWIEDHFFDRAREKGIELKISTLESPVDFTTDRTLLQLILQNLLDNAMKFTSTGGTVSFDISQTEAGLNFTVTDSGRGIPPQLQGRVFERFFQVETSRTGDAKKRGTGLGLAIVKHAAERLNAEVLLQSEPLKGTTFTVKLPIAKAIHV